MTRQPSPREECWGELPLPFFNLWKKIGPMNAAHAHLIFNHMPILGSLASLFFLLYGFWRRDEQFLKFVFQWLILVGLLTIPAFLTGEPAEEHIEHLAGISETLIEAHEDAAKFGLIITEVLAAMGLFGIFLFYKRSEKIMALTKVLILVAILNVATMVRIGNLGGEIRHPEIRKDHSQPAA